MKDENMTKEQLIDELAAMRQRVVEIEINHKRAEEALRESEESYRQLVEQPFDGVFVRSQDKILFMNKAGARILGVEDPSQFVGKSVLDFLHPDYHEFVRKRVQEVYETGKFVPLVEEKFIRFDGKVIDVEVAATAFTYGGAPAVQVIFRDITERKQAEEEREKLVHDLQKALSEVKTLKGIFPICASCKKIRDDKGYWNQVEVYIRDRSEAEFSHGICPDCMKKLYGDFLKEEDTSRKQ
jgi:PAS domain S-box-containing protein